MEWAVLKIAGAVIPWLPRGLLRAVAVPLGAAAAVLDRRGRHAAGENLHSAFPDMSAGEIRRIRRRSYQLFARTFLELFWGQRLTPENVSRWCRVEFASPAAREAVSGGCLFATIHFGNFEWLSLAAALSGFPCMVVAQNFKNARLTPVFRSLRSHGGAEIIPQEGAMLRIFKHLKRKGRAAALVDLNVPPDQSAAIIRCFGRETCVTVMHAALAGRSGAPIVPALAIPQRDGTYLCRFFDPLPVEPDAPLSRACQRCWDVFEPFIRQDPAAWMWMYKHWRYRPKEADPREYPAYANVSGKFEKLRGGIQR